MSCQVIRLAWLSVVGCARICPAPVGAGPLAASNATAACYANRIAAPAFSLLRTMVMNLLRRDDYRSIRQGLRTLAHDINGILRLGGVQLAENGT